MRQKNDSLRKRWFYNYCCKPGISLESSYAPFRNIPVRVAYPIVAKELIVVVVMKAPVFIRVKRGMSGCLAIVSDVNN